LKIFPNQDAEILAGPDFYAACVRDLDGNKLAAVCRGFF
jgi:hypothetical protein